MISYFTHAARRLLAGGFLVTATLAGWPASTGAEVIDFRRVWPSTFGTLVGTHWDWRFQSISGDSIFQLTGAANGVTCMWDTYGWLDDRDMLVMTYSGAGCDGALDFLNVAPPMFVAPRYYDTGTGVHRTVQSGSYTRTRDWRIVEHGTYHHTITIAPHATVPETGEVGIRITGSTTYTSATGSSFHSVEEVYVVKPARVCHAGRLLPAEEHDRWMVRYYRNNQGFSNLIECER